MLHNTAKVAIYHIHTKKTINFFTISGEKEGERQVVLIRM